MPKKIEVMDGNQAAAYASYAFTEVAGIFPITPSSPMAEYVDDWSAKGKKNIFGQTVDVVEMQSEGGAAGTVHGSLEAGALTTTYTASQGLLLMIPNMYKIAGELLPGVFHVSARTVSSHALSIFGDHSDVMACRQTGFALLASAGPQEVMDLAAVAHLSAIKGRVPFLHFFDGFRTSHEIQKIEALDYDDLRPLVDMEALNRFRRNALNPDHPVVRGTTVNPDIFFQAREAQNEYYTRLPEIVEEYMDKISQLTGRNYRLFEYYGAPDATDLVVAMGSVADTIKETVDVLTAQGRKVGMVNVHLYRPFSMRHFLDAVPETVRRIAVLDRTKEPGSLGEPLYEDVVNLYYKAGRPMEIVGGRYGLASKDTTPAQILAVYENLAAPEPKNNFTNALEDDVTFLSLPKLPELDTASDCTCCKLWGLGSDGTVGANKNTIKIIGKHTDLYTQAYFVYDSKKSGGLTQSHLRFGKNPIRSAYLVNKADFVACHNQAYVRTYDMVKDLKPGGIFLLNCQWSPEELEEQLPAEMRRALAEKDAKLYLIDAVDIAGGLGLGNKINAVLQAAFFKLTNIIPFDQAVTYMKDAIQTTYGRKGQDVVEKNCAAIDAGAAGLRAVEIPEAWKTAQETEEPAKASVPDFIRNVVEPINRQEGDSLPVSMYRDIPDGTWPVGTSAYEKRGVAVRVPQWNADKCIQCNQCAFVCPHAAIRPVLLDEKEKAAAPTGFGTVPAKGKGLEAYAYRMQVSPYDCTGCGSCTIICPVGGGALTMKPLATQLGEHENWTYATEQVAVKKDAVDPSTVKGSQFAQPLFQFSGACAGCGETPYIKLATQLFGDRMYIANASGCSTAYSGSTPSTPYTVNKEGHGPTWAMSLFEDCAEYGYGMLLGAEKVRSRLADYAKRLEGTSVDSEAKAYLEKKESEESEAVSQAFLKAVEDFAPANEEQAQMKQFIQENSDFLRRRSYWAFGGDGWAYDIGYGGLDHVLASGKNINMLVLDTEVYSNTGGQSSKATCAAAVAKFASSGKKTKKKDLGMMAMSYGYVYVAQVAMGYDKAQVLKAMREAEAYDGPSLIIAYCPCIEHGPKCGMGESQLEMKRAVECGYWHLYRYNPELKKQGKNPFILDSKEPTGDLRAFMRGEVRYASLETSFPQQAAELFDKAVADAKERLENYKRLARG
ncbi:MAG: pyruvate:ferredoxin (flavodoxin) oxidoreductase [Oscillospiraceae bacterium]|nr:pyruvate:ferredoxin (flavodoxin) oxidoreductase [Oscillospiraceae bacterium]